MRALAEAPPPLPPTAADGHTWDSPEARQAAARDTYRASRHSGTSITGAELARRYGMSERWGRDRIAEARAADLDQVPTPQATLPRRSVNAARRQGGATSQPDQNGSRWSAGNGSLTADGGGSNGTTPRQTGNGNGTTPRETGNGNGNHGTPGNGSLATSSAGSSGKSSGCPLASSRDTPSGQVQVPSGAAPPTTNPHVATQSASRWLDSAITLIVALVAAAASYGHMLEVALSAGEPLWIAKAFPITVDGLVLAALRCGERGRRWLVLGVIVSVAANVLAQFPDQAAAAGPFVSAWPPLALYGTHQLLQSRSSSHGRLSATGLGRSGR